MRKKSVFIRAQVWLWLAMFIGGIFVADLHAATVQDSHLKRPAAAATEAADLQKRLRDGGDFDEAEVVHLKEFMGANGILPISASAVRASSAEFQLPEYAYMAQYLGNDPRRKSFTIADFLEAVQTVYPEFNIMNGGAHAGWVTDIQEFMILVGMHMRMPFWQRMEIANKVVAALTEIFKDPKELTRILGRPVEKPFMTLVGDEGGYAPDLRGNAEAFKLIVAAIERAGMQKYVQPATDAASSEFYDEETGSYVLKSEGRTLTRKEWVAQLKEWFDEFKVAAAEDICAENDHQGYRQAYKLMGDTMVIVGDDLTVTNLKMLKESIRTRAPEINTILIKINQNGSMSGTIEVIQYALAHGISVAISHRSGETEDDIIADLAIASNLFLKNPHPKTGKMPVVMLKTGGFRRTDRIVKYNRFLDVEAELERQIKAGRVTIEPLMKLSDERRDNAKLSPTVITGVRGVEIYDSRGNPTTKAFVRLNNGFEKGNATPSGASTGTRESRELRDAVEVKNNPHRIDQKFVDRVMPGASIEEARKNLASRVGGKGVLIAVDNINHWLGAAVKLAQVDVKSIDSFEKLAAFDKILTDVEVAAAQNEQQRRKAIVKDGGTVVAIVGGTGDMGKALADRLRLAGVEVLIGSRKANPEAGILANADAVRQADVVVFAVPAQHVESTVRDLAQYLKKDAIVLSIAAPFRPVERVLTYTPPQGYVSAAQQVAGIIQEQAPEKNIRVVSAGIQSVPAEWMANPSLALNQQIVVSGEEQACSLACEKVLNRINPGLKPVISGTLDECCNVEALTPRIVASKKELLAVGSRSVEELVAFVKEKGTAVSTQEIVDFNRQKLDPALKERYADQATLVSDIMTVINSKLSVEEKEIVAVGLRRYADIVSGQSPQKQQVSEALLRYDLNTADVKFNRQLPGDFAAFVDTVKAVETADGALVLSANTILKNAGTVDMVRTLKEKDVNQVRVVAWAKDMKEELALRLTGIGEIAEIKQAPVSKIVEELSAKNGIAAEKIVIVGFEGEVKLEQNNGPLVLNLKAPKLDREKKEFLVNAMPLVLAKALASIYSNNNQISQELEKLGQAYFTAKNITAEDLKALVSAAADSFNMPLVKVTDEVAREQTTYEGTITNI